MRGPVTWRWAGTGAMALMAGLAVALALAWSGSPGPLVGGVLWAAVLVVPGYWSLSFTLGGSNRAFFTAFLAALGLRLAGLLAAALWLAVRRPVDLAPACLAVAGGLMALGLAEALFIERQNRAAQAARADPGRPPTAFLRREAPAPLP